MPKDTMARLEVIDLLEIGPVRLEPQRLVAPYQVHQAGLVDSTELIYRFEEDVFDPADKAAENLASMIAAQVAINYGLFCKRIVFHGLYDDTDRRFIADMIENTAREIYVKKFLQPNPFLIGDAASLKPEKRKTYSRAVLEYPDSGTSAPKAKWQFWAADSGRHCILSSGGKDSLASYALLNEIGREVHPIFVNESGRHWFTALNAYRHFKENVPNTARVWVNCDRVYTWMLRHLPFIRQDFASVRADIYPIRLWTVAVFLFGALPLMRKRGIGRLIIGDEYDTTIRTSHEGITHYDGLYDQSRYFDDALSRFYMRKGWDTSQFSVLRPVSELLIQTILAKRYPKLQQHQVSCHAAHKQDERVYPCGKCEKCRRIVGMLTAAGADPHQCGYTDKQIEDCLKALTTAGLHQEAPVVEHVVYTLSQKGLIQLTDADRKMAREHPVVQKLRFTQERSPMDGIPVDLRLPLYRILMEHTNGAVRRQGRQWVEIDPLTDPAINQPYVFEMAQDRGSKAGTTPTVSPKTAFLWAELTWPDAEKRLKEMDVALLPVGSIEQHGPHLPLDTDAYDADYLARRVAQACSDPKPLVLPGIPYGVSYHHDEFPGTISISNDALSRLVYEIGMNVARSGINKLVIINGHGDNSPTLSYAAQMINRDAHIFVTVDTGETSDVDLYELVDTPNDVHAGEIETSTTLAIRPHLVHMEKAKRLVPEFSSRYLDFTSKRSVPWYAYTKKISATGVMGDPTKANAEKGKKMWEIMIAHLVAFIEDLKNMTLEEIYQKRY